MLGRIEQHEIQQLIYAELARIENDLVAHAGSFNYVCLVAGSPCLTHHPQGPVLRTIYHPLAG